MKLFLQHWEKQKLIHLLLETAATKMENIPEVTLIVTGRPQEMNRKHPEKLQELKLVSSILCQLVSLRPAPPTAESNKEQADKAEKWFSECQPQHHKAEYSRVSWNKRK